VHGFSYYIPDQLGLLNFTQYIEQIKNRKVAPGGSGEIVCFLRPCETTFRHLKTVPYCYPGLCKRDSDIDQSNRYQIVLKKLLRGNLAAINPGAVFTRQILDYQALPDYFEFCMVSGNKVISQNHITLFASDCTRRRYREALTL
jgi:hypothetical protein